TSCKSGPSKRQSTVLEVIHRHGPCSQAQQTTTPQLAEILSDDQSRVESIQARLKPDSDTNKLTNNKQNNKLKEKKADLPAQPGRSFRTGNYIVSIGLGTPKINLSLIFDTGSDLTWTQCQPCAQRCYQQQEPIFNPHDSSSYSNVSCTAPECAQLPSATNVDPGCSSGTCVYGLEYGDNSITVGFLVKDKLTVTPTDVFPDFVFGCGQNNQGLFGNTAGLIGLGRDNLSFVSQTATKYGGYFSYCLPSSSSSTGHLAFGKNGASNPKNVRFTPFASSQDKSFYFVDIVYITVGGNRLEISKSVFETAGTVIDSGTVISRLPQGAYGPMSAAFQQLMGNYKRAPAYLLLDTCYDFANSKTVKIPKIAFGFNGDVEVDVDESGILIPVNSTVACLAFAGNGDEEDVGIFGSAQQKTFEVVYDVAGGKLGFGPGRCA
ncbi:aspartic proteinase nepenthesin-2, partial [Phtheirospermum japonicum]